MVKEGTGPYGGAIIKFQIRVQLANYPRHRPRVFFDEGVKIFHPLVDSLSNELKMLLEWKEDANWLIDVLMYVKKAFHLKEFMDVEKSIACNQDALAIFKSDYPEFVKQC